MLIPLIVLCIIIKVIYVLSGDSKNSIFKQERIGKDSRKFDIFKFRTMTPDADKQLSELLENSDIISLHCPLTSENRHMMNKTAFAKCKKKPLLVNTARGGLVDENALKDAVESGLLSGAALDAITVEPMRNCVLKGIENIVITPHAAWAPMSTRIKLLGITVDCIKAWLDGNPINVVSK